MTATSTSDRTAEEELLRQCLVEAAPDVFGPAPSQIVGIRRSRFELMTSYSVHLLTVRLSSGAERMVFLKDFGVTVRAKDEPDQRRERELRVYREILAGAGIGTPRYYGSVWQETAGHHWLLLEFVPGTPVGYLRDFARWAPAAAGLGRVHGHFAGHLDRLRRHDFLIRCDEDFFRGKAEEALRDVGVIAPPQVGRLRRLVRLYLALVPLMLDQPQSLLHGGCRATNILVEIASDPSRACVLDWEEAALGPPLVDVAYLLDGIAPPAAAPLLDAYRREAASHGLSLPPPGEMAHLVQCYRLGMVMASLSRAVAKRFRHKGIAMLLSLGEQIGAALGRVGA